MLIKLAEAIGRLLLAGREMTRLAGFTARMSELIKVLDDLNVGRYERSMVNTQGNQVNNISQQSLPMNGLDNNFWAGKGQLEIVDNVIRFDAVPLVTPNGDVLVKKLSFEVKYESNLYIEIYVNSSIIFDFWLWHIIFIGLE